MECNKCGNTFEPSKGLKKYCSLSCRNSRAFTEEALLKKSISRKAYIDRLSEEELVIRATKLAAANSDKDKIDKHKEAYREKYLQKSWDELSVFQQRRRVLEEQNFKCNKCDLSEWMGQPLTLEIDHKNGIHSDNTRDNVEGLCPNCHSITPTWRGRNKQNNKVTDDQLLDAINSHPSLRQALIALGLSPKGANYTRITKLKNSLTL